MRGRRATRRRSAILDWLSGRREGWLDAAAYAARERTEEDYAAFRADPGVVEWVSPAGGG